MMKLLTLLLAAVIGAAQDHDVIPDFSRVGYHYGDREIPELPVKATITQKSLRKGIRQYGDTTAYIQSVIDRVGRSGGGAVLLSNGTYNVGRILFIDYDNVVLRGESREGTVLMCSGTDKRPAIALGKTVAPTGTKNEADQAGRALTVNRLKSAGAGGAGSYGKTFIVTYHAKAAPYKINRKAGAVVAEDYVPVGRLSLEVGDASSFKPGQHVVLNMPHSREWVEAIGMDRMACNGREGIKAGTIQWTDRKFEMNWERVVTRVEGNVIWLDAPVVMALDKRFGPCYVCPVQAEYLMESGVENLTVDSTFDSSVTKGNDFIDESHTWNAVEITSAEHCWVRNVTSHHMGYALVDVRACARNITVRDCTFLEPVSVVTGARRYAFCLTRGSLCLFKNCRCDNDRHGFITNGNVPGPNVYTRCEGTAMRSTVGPHQSWATGCLYDCIKADGTFEIQDRGNYGTGHGWAGANFVFWNCEATGEKSEVVCQSPWDAGRNYCVGLIGKKGIGRKYERDYYGKPTEDWFIRNKGVGPSGESRPDGEWYPALAYGAVGSSHVVLPCDPGLSWWPLFAIPSFSDPLSLYECQLESRHAQGIDLGDLK